MQAKPFFHSIRFQFILEYRTHKIGFLAEFSFVENLWKVLNDTWLIWNESTLNS